MRPGHPKVAVNLDIPGYHFRTLRSTDLAQPEHAPGGVQAVRVFWLREVSRPQGAEVITGYVEVDGHLRVARAHQVYLAAVPGHVKLGERMFADLRQSIRVPAEYLQAAGRVGAMSHDARIAVLRRDAYFRYRWPLGLDDVLKLERSRIEADHYFVGPRPQWTAT